MPGDKDYTLEEAVRMMEGVVCALESPTNQVWHTKKPWTKKERDEVILTYARRTYATLKAAIEREAKVEAIADRMLDIIQSKEPL